MTQTVTEPASNDDSFAEDSPPMEGAGENDLDRLLAEISLKTAALQEEVAGDSAGTSGDLHSHEGDSPALADQKADVDVQMADVQALVSAAKIDVGAEIDDQSVAPAAGLSLPSSASECPEVASDDSTMPPECPAETDAASSVRIPSEYSEDRPETASGDSEVDTPDRLDIDKGTDAASATGPSAWGQALLTACLSLVDMLDRRMGWLGSGDRHILGIAAVATFVTAVALWMVSFVVAPDVPT